VTLNCEKVFVLEEFSYSLEKNKYMKRKRTQWAFLYQLSAKTATCGFNETQFPGVTKLKLSYFLED
jgi:hypothetical protein